MKSSKSKSTLDTTTSNLRKLVQATELDALIGSEDDLVARLGVSRATIRQAARLLEREGWLAVRRGLNGGYFANRPDIDSIERGVNAYLEMVDANIKEIVDMGSVLWVLVVRNVAGLRTARAKEVIANLRGKVLALRFQASFEEILGIEMEIRSTFFELINYRYIELIFRMTLRFAEQKFPEPSCGLNDTAEQTAFLESWRQAKLMELASIEDGDQDLAALAARHSRNVWVKRYWRDSHS
jgi:DNA-binding FadR family transcriptional regulator